MRVVCQIFVAVLAVACGGGRRGPPVDMVVPKGFTGPVWIVLDPDGQDIPLVEDRFRVVIPAGGVLQVQTFTPFQEWHQSSAQEDDGSPLPKGFDDGADAVALHGGGIANSQRVCKEFYWMPYFVGTAKQYDERPAHEFPAWTGR